MLKVMKLFTVVMMSFFWMSVVPSWAGEVASEVFSKIIVEIDYGDVRPSRTVEVVLTENQTVLELLQTVAVVETQPADGFVLVTAIDGVVGKRGEMAWYYYIDGKMGDESAYTKVLHHEKHIKWTYKKDMCSWTVDGKPKLTTEEGVKKD